MPDTKITALAAITTVAPANDLFAIVDVSDNSMAASGTTKNITTNQILGAGGTATLASATISGDLGVGTASPSTKLEVATATANTRLRINSTSVVATEYFRSGTGLWLVGSDSTNAFKIARGSNFGGSADYFSIGSATADCTWFDAAGGTRMTLNSTGLGVGVVPSAGKFEVQESGTGSGIGGIFTSTVSGGGNPGVVFRTASTNRWSLSLTGSAGAESIRFYDINNSATRMTLDASGNLLCGSTALNATWNTRLTLSSDSGTTRWAVGPYSTATNFVISAASGGGVYLNGTAATSWTSASDERLKDIIEPISNAIAKVGSLRAVIGKFKSDDTNTRKSFLMAQDVQSVLPEAVDASNPNRLGLAYTEVIPLLVAAIKELTARVQTLETR